MQAATTEGSLSTPQFFNIVAHLRREISRSPRPIYSRFLPLAHVRARAFPDSVISFPAGRHAPGRIHGSVVHRTYKKNRIPITGVFVIADTLFRTVGKTRITARNLSLAPVILHILGRKLRILYDNPHVLGHIAVGVVCPDSRAVSFRDADGADRMEEISRRNYAQIKEDATGIVPRELRRIAEDAALRRLLAKK